jgi:thioredoxin 1
MSAIQVSDGDFNRLVLMSDKPVLVDFYADWCGPCKLAAPIIEELSETYKDQMVIAKLDVDANPQTSAQFGVMSIPTVMVFKKGQEADRKVGYGGREGYESLIKKALA